MIQFTQIADDNQSLALSPLLRGAQLTLEYIEANGPIGLTPLKALKRYFVQWAAEAFAWPFYGPEDLYYLNKVLNEQDFPPLMVLHDVLLSAKLVRHAKRVDPGVALQALKLDGYRDLPIKPSEIPPRLAASETSETPSVPDGGTFMINGEKLYWTPPGHIPFEPEELQLFDRDGNELEPSLAMPPAAASSWVLPDLGTRPRTARIRYGDVWSAPTIIVDLDELAIRTMPPHRGKKRRFVDYLDETQFEDPDLLQVINELEALDLEERSNGAERLTSLPGGKDRKDDAEEHRLLSYEDFVRARERARLADDHQGGRWFGKRHDSAADLVSLCLNRLIGLVSRDLSSDEEEDLRRQAEIDLRGSEPTTPDDQEAPEPEHRAQPADQPTVRQQAQATAKKIEDAIRAFEQRTKAMAQQRISTTELVRLRTLLQIVLAYAEPVDRQRDERTVLPIAAEGGDWPRLLGRLLIQHFRTIRALQMLDVEPDENEHQRVLEYLSMAHFAARMAVAGARQSGPQNSLIAPLERLATDVETQVRTVIGLQEGEGEKFNEIIGRLNERFAGKLKLPLVPGFQSSAKGMKIVHGQACPPPMASIGTIKFHECAYYFSSCGYDPARPANALVSHDWLKFSL
jgi:hypothetical protein